MKTKALPSRPGTPAQIAAYGNTCRYCGATPGEACRNMRMVSGNKTVGPTFHPAKFTYTRWPHFHRETP